VLINLTNNAIKFTDKGEIVVSIRLQQMEQHAAVLRVDVRDTGIGLTPAQRSKLFQAFTRPTPPPRATMAARAWD
jgi:signal transduction histidine kinase